MNEGFKTGSTWLGLCVRLKDISFTFTTSRRLLRALLRLPPVLAAIRFIILKILYLCEPVYYYYFKLLLCPMISSCILHT